MSRSGLDEGLRYLKCILLGFFVTNNSIRVMTYKGTFSTWPRLLLIIFCALAWSPSLSFGQGPPSENGTESVNVALQPLPLESKRILGIIPNNRTWPSLKDYKPLSTKEKFEIARQDSFDRGTVVLAAAFAADAQFTNADPSFGQGVKGYSYYFGTSYADLVIGNYMSEAIFPTLLHQDPRYFRRGIGSKRSRLEYAMGQIFWTHTDSDRTQFNYSEILGNSTAVAISEAYYPDHRNAANAGSKLGIQLGVDMASNILKEFWPDVSRKFSRKDRQ
jgi:hypothetical protein